MLRELSIENFVLLRKVQLAFEDHFHVFTGETGAGKSMLLQALLFLFGQPVSSDSVGPFGDTMAVSGLLEIPPHLENQLEDMGIPVEEGELSLRRTLSRKSRRSRNYANGVPISVRVLKELASLFLDVHSQHESRLLFSPAFHRDVLDQYLDLGELRERFRHFYREYQEVCRQLEEAQEEEQHRRERLEFLQFQIDELKDLGLTPGEKEALSERYDLLSRSAELGEKAHQWRQRLIEAEESVLDQIARCGQTFEEFRRLHKSLDELVDVAEQARILVNQMGRLLEEVEGQVHWDPEELRRLEERLQQIDSLERKYHREGDELLTYLDQLKQERERLEGLAVCREQLVERKDELWQKLQSVGLELRRAREKGRGLLEEALEKELRELGMEWAKVVLQIQPLEGERKLSASGLDKVEFWISPNPGLDPKPLREIGSGGELSRITLALKSILSRYYQVPILFFDEVDSGVGGRRGHTLAKKLRALAEHHQVFCITHLPQIAAAAERHYHIAKSVRDGQTETEVRPLRPEERVTEIASMLRGEEATETTYLEARELLHQFGG